MRVEDLTGPDGPPGEAESDAGSEARGPALQGGPSTDTDRYCALTSFFVIGTWSPKLTWQK